MVPARDGAVLADAIARVLDDPELAHRLSQTSRQKVAREFHHRRGAEALAEALGVSPVAAAAAASSAGASRIGVGHPEQHANGKAL
jgi:hypothetical protein